MPLHKLDLHPFNCSHLYRGDGSLFGGGDSFLHGTHVSGQGRLDNSTAEGILPNKADTWGKKKNHIVSLGLHHSIKRSNEPGSPKPTSEPAYEAEDVINKQQHILTFLVSEILSAGGQPSQSNPGARAPGGSFI